MKKLKLISLLCSLLMVLSCFSVFPAFAAEETAYNYQGEGTRDNPYILTNKNFQDFMTQAATANAFKTTSFKLGENIVLNNGANDGTAEDWAAGTKTPTLVLNKPIIDYDFNGIFDGNGYAISGICMIAGDGVTEVGIFKRLSYDSGFVKNLRLVNSYFEMSSVTENSAMGSIAAKIFYNAQVTNCYTDAILTHKKATEAASTTNTVSIGGIVGAFGQSNTNMSWSPIISNCVFAGSILNNIGATGGIIGWVPASDAQGKTATMTISDCLNLGSVNSSVSGANVSAIVGSVNWEKVALTIKNCMNLSANVPAEILGNNNCNMIKVDGTVFVDVADLGQKDRQYTPGFKASDLAVWTTETTLSAFLNGDVTAIAGWTYKAGFVPNPTTHTNIPLTAIINAETLGLKTTGEIHSIRISNTNKGLRFETFVSDAGVNLLAELAKVEGATVAMNTYISAGKYFTGNDAITEFTAATLDKGVDAGSRYLKVTATEFLRKNGENGETVNTFAGSVVNIKDVTMNYIAVGCVTVTVGDKTYDVYADWNTDEITSVSAVATAAAADTKDEADIEGGYGYKITDINGAEVYSPYTQAQYDCIKSLIAE